MLRPLLVVAILCISVVLAQPHQAPPRDHVNDAMVEDVAHLSGAALLEALEIAAAVNKPVMWAMGESQTAFGQQEDGWVNSMAASYGSTLDILGKVRAVLQSHGSATVF